ncbi:MAG: hypothetical protein ACFCBU_12485, partial [Cyanophyceae cyanobacterium]
MSSSPRGNSRFSSRAVGRSQPTVTTIRPPGSFHKVRVSKGSSAGGVKKNSDSLDSGRSPAGGLLKEASASAIMVLFLALAGVVGGTWVGLAYILNPDSVAWLGPLLPQ